MQRWIRRRMICMRCEQFLTYQMPTAGSLASLLCPFCRSIQIRPVWINDEPPPRPF